MTHITIDELIRKNNNNLDFIRILCAYFVIFSHSFILSPQLGYQDILYKITQLQDVSLGGVAVKTFFMISGMLVTNSLLSNGKIINYISSRFFRVYPAFIFTVVVSALFISPFLTKLSISEYFYSAELWNYTFETLKMNIQYILPGVFDQNNLKAFNGSLWSIPFEVTAYFYLIISYLLSLLFGQYKKYFLGIISLIIIIQPFTPLKDIYHTNLTDPNIYLLYPFFALGALITLLKKQVTTGTCLIISLLSLFSLFFIDNVLYKITFIYLFLCISLLYISSLSIIKKVKIKHDISYGIYLWSFPIQQLMASMVITSPHVNMILTVIVSSLFGYLSFKFIEKPAMNFNKLLFSEKTLISKSNNEIKIP